MMSLTPHCCDTAAIVGSLLLFVCPRVSIPNESFPSIGSFIAGRVQVGIIRPVEEITLVCFLYLQFCVLALASEILLDFVVEVPDAHNSHLRMIVALTI